MTKNKCMQIRRDKGLCAMCGKVPSVRFRCEECNAVNNLRIWRLRRSRRELATQE
jgi:hypothetical protein